MVKNTGGNKAKGYASKDMKPKGNSKLREAEDEGELYAIVTKLLGNGMCNVFCIADDTVRLCMIRGKFRGKGKSSNLIGNGTWVLVGERSWESADKKMKTCDLIEVYSALEKDRLKSVLSEEDIDNLISHDVTNISTPENHSGVSFMSQKQIDYMETMERSLQTAHKAVEFTSLTMSSSMTHEEDEIIDVSDI